MLNSKKPLFSYLRNQSAKVRRQVEKENAVNLKLITLLCNSQFDLVKRTMGFMERPDLSGRSQIEPILFSALYKNLISFYSAIELISNGLHGPSMVLIRPIFESLYLAKYCYLSGNSPLFRRWESGEHINITNEVLNKIKGIDLSESKRLLKALNQFSHHTIYSSQMSLDYNLESQSISSGICTIKILATASHHLLNRHYITGQTRYYMEHYGDWEKFKITTDTARELYRISRASMTKPARKAVIEYSSSWVF